MGLFTIMIDNKNMERRGWSEDEDNALKVLYESLRVNKWSQIAEQLQVEYGFGGRTGKQCRQRYNNHLDPALSKDEWSLEQEMKLYQLHDQLGNKWAVISQRLSTNRTDNTIKNHFYSRLRKSLRRLNKIIQQSYKKEIREIQTKVLYKIIEASQEKFKLQPMCEPQLSEYSTKLKNKILLFSYDHEDAQLPPQDEARDLIQEIIDFNRRYKRKPKKLRKIGSSYQQIEQGQRCQIKKSYSSKLQLLERGEPSASFSCFSKESPEVKQQQNSDQDQINPLVKVETQKQKFISPIILTTNPCSPPLDQPTDKPNGQQMLEALGLLEDSISMPHPIFMKKNTSMMSSDHSQQQQSKFCAFFDDSSAEMKMETPHLGTFKKESMEEGSLFHCG